MVAVAKGVAKGVGVGAKVVAKGVVVVVSSSKSITTLTTYRTRKVVVV